MNEVERERLINQISGFLDEIGIAVFFREIAETTFLPGILIDGETLVVDRAKLQHLGDLLHEAGHIAVVAPLERPRLFNRLGTDGGNEMAATAWSWGALKHLQIAPELVFHADGYKGGAHSIIDNFSQGQYFGVPLLQWFGMTAEGDAARELGVEPYPHMIQWLRR